MSTRTPHDEAHARIERWRQEIDRAATVPALHAASLALAGETTAHLGRDHTFVLVGASEDAIQAAHAVAHEVDDQAEAAELIEAAWNGPDPLESVLYEVYCHEWVDVLRGQTSKPCSVCGSRFEAEDVAARAMSALRQPVDPDHALLDPDPWSADETLIELGDIDGGGA